MILGSKEEEEEEEEEEVDTTLFLYVFLGLIAGNIPLARSTLLIKYSIVILIGSVVII